MLDVEEKEQIRRAVLVEGKSQRQVAREAGHSRNTLRKMLEDGKAPRYRQKRLRRSPVLGPFKQDARLVGALLDRLTHHCHVVEFEGDSFRFRQSLSRQSDAAPGDGVREDRD